MEAVLWAQMQQLPIQSVQSAEFAGAYGVCAEGVAGDGIGA